MNSLFTRFKAEPAEIQFFPTQVASDGWHTLKFTGAINQKRPVRNSPCDIIYVQILSDNHGRSVSFLMKPPNVSVYRRERETYYNSY